MKLHALDFQLAVAQAHDDAVGRGRGDFQAIGQAFGGEVIRAPVPKHGKLSDIYHSSAGLFKNIPSPFLAARYHSLVVERETLPASLEISATTPDGVIMGLRHRELKIEGVQFHPESILTTDGKKLLSNFLKL